MTGPGWAAVSRASMMSRNDLCLPGLPAGKRCGRGMAAAMSCGWRTGGSPARLRRSGSFPVLELSHHFGARAALAVGYPSTEAVLPLDFIGGDDVLEVPGGV